MGTPSRTARTTTARARVALLAIARVMQQAPVKPRRSVLFVWHVGEEKGLLGSSWFTEHPTVPIDSIVAQLNADMIGRNADTLLYVVGPLAAPNNQSKRLGAILDSVNAAVPTPFRFNREWDSATHPEHIYERSDHFNYARKGIPIVFFTTGLHADYHKVSDEPRKIDFAKMARVTRLMRNWGAPWRIRRGDRASATSSAVAVRECQLCALATASRRQTQRNGSCQSFLQSRGMTGEEVRHDPGDGPTSPHA